jgi:hypothetical protein
MRIRGVPTTMYSRPEKLPSSEAGQYFLSFRSTIEDEPKRYVVRARCLRPQRRFELTSS